jgi:peptidoglycan-associated lipoprotein
MMLVTRAAAGRAADQLAAPTRTRAGRRMAGTSSSAPPTVTAAAVRARHGERPDPPAAAGTGLRPARPGRPRSASDRPFRCSRPLNAAYAAHPRQTLRHLSGGPMKLRHIALVLALVGLTCWAAASAAPGRPRPPGRRTDDAARERARADSIARPSEAEREAGAPREMRERRGDGARPRGAHRDDLLRVRQRPAHLRGGGAAPPEGAILRANPNAQLRIEGHADERGSTEYNLALGQRRAEAVRSFLADFGIGRTGSPRSRTARSARSWRDPARRPGRATAARSSWSPAGEPSPTGATLMNAGSSLVAAARCCRWRPARPSATCVNLQLEVDSLRVAGHDAA